MDEAVWIETQEDRRQIYLKLDDISARLKSIEGILRHYRLVLMDE